MTGRVTDGIRRACGIVEGMRDNEFAEATVRKAAVAEECDRLDEAVEAARHDAWDEGFEAGREWLAEDREAIAWVREHGGRVQVEIDYAVYEGFSDLADEVAQRLGLCIDGLDAQDSRPLLMDALDRRLMPEGMTWPRFESGEPVSIGDQFAEHGGCENVIDSVEVGDCWFKIHGFDGAAPRYSKRASVKRPAPKVLDADGVEIHVEDTVYEIETGERYFVTNVFDGMTEPDFPEHTVECRKYEDVVTHMFRPSQLTHERPVADTWERLEEDAGKNPFDYCKDVGHRLDTCENSEAYKARDLVRRAKKLAGVSE